MKAYINPDVPPDKRTNYRNYVAYMENKKRWARIYADQARAEEMKVRPTFLYKANKASGRLFDIVYDNSIGLVGKFFRSYFVERVAVFIVGVLILTGLARFPLWLSALLSLLSAANIDLEREIWRGMTKRPEDKDKQDKP